MEERVPVLRTKNLVIGYGRGKKCQQILNNIRLYVNSGQMISLIGANGTGKSTLIRTLAGLQPALSGEIWVNGRKTGSMTPAELASQLSIVLTEKIQAGYLTVGDLVAMGRHPYTDWRGRMDPDDLNATMDALQITGLSDLSRVDLYKLSDGQQQKAMIARALAQDGDLMLLDEPLIHLDIPSKWEIMGLLKRMIQERKKTVILATHELELSLQMADSIWLINKNRELVVGTPEDMILQGTIAETFNTAHYKFNRKKLY